MAGPVISIIDKGECFLETETRGARVSKIESWDWIWRDAGQSYGRLTKLSIP